MDCTPEQIKRFKRFAQDPTATNKDIADVLGCSISDVCQMRIKYGITPDKATIAKVYKQRKRLIKLLAPAFKLADESITDIKLVEHDTVNVMIGSDCAIRVNIKGESLIAIIFDIARAILF